jgi:DNA-binding transcriptional MerR regulator
LVTIMTSLEETPTFNLKAVVQETGLKPDTLRAWERRYGLPKPARTAGGHRLYSQLDIDILHWLIARQDEGLTISRAVDLWRQLRAEGKDPFWEMELQNDETQLPAPLEVGDALSDLRQSWIEACLDFNEQRAEYTLSQAFALYPTETVCFELLQKGLSEIGSLWYEGKATPQQEHFASELAIRRLEALIAANPPPTRSGRILIGCAAGEEHTFSSLVLTLLLRRRGWATIYLGANVPDNRLLRTVERSLPDLVVLVAHTLPSAATLFAMARQLQEEEIPLAFGGLIFNALPSLPARIPGHFLGNKLERAVANVERLLSNPSLTPNALSAAELESYEQAVKHFRERQWRIEAHIWEHAKQLQVNTQALAQANRSLAQNIAAALTLGNLDYLKRELDWANGLLHNHRHPMPAEILQAYLRLYHEAASHELGEPGAIIVDWLASQLSARSNGSAQSE